MAKPSHFEAWVARKDGFERGKELLGQLDDTRQADPEKFREITVALAAIERSLGADDDDAEDDGRARRRHDVWRRWAMEQHAFTEVIVSRADERSLSQALVEGAGQNEAGELVLPTLRYVFPAKPHNKSVMPKPLSPDQLAQNALFLRECRRHWRAAEREVRVLLGRYLAQHSTSLEREASAKVVTRGLRRLGVGKLAGWVEEDVEAIRQAKKAKEAEKLDEARRTHAGFVREKRARQIKIPAELATTAAPPPPRFDLSKSGVSTKPVRPRKKRQEQTTIDLMRGAGMTVVHSLTRPSVRGGDLEASRRRLLEHGYVARANFDAPTDALHEDFDSGNFADVRKKYAGAKADAATRRTQRSKQEFGAWSNAKAGRAEALKCLEALEPPAALATHDGPKEVLAYWRRVGALLKAVDSSLLAEWLDWSRLRADQTKLKSVVSSSSSIAEVGGVVTSNSAPPKSTEAFDWAIQLGGLPASPAAASALWCALAPRGCDVSRPSSCGGVSALKAALLRLLKSALDFAPALDALEARLKRRVGDGDGDKKNDLFASSADLRRCLRDGGMVFSADEARCVVDCLDAYAGHGAAPLNALRDFIGKRTRSGDVACVLRRLTYFEATCHETGMANAYRVTSGVRARTKHEVDVDCLNGEVRCRWTNPDLDHRRDQLARLGLCDSKGNFKAHDLKDEYGQNDDDDDDDDEYSEDDAEEDEDRYDSDHYGGDDDFEDDEGPHRSPKNKKKKGSSAYGGVGSGPLVKWFGAKGSKAPPAVSFVAKFGVWGAPRRRALEALRELSAEARREDLLRAALVGGAPPAAPELWAASLDELEHEGVPRGALLTRLVCRWRPASEQATPLAFFSLEFSGALGSKAQRENRFVEIARDPPSARADAFSFQHVISGLEPNTTYVFRLRAFNAFGAGNYSWRRLTTPPAPPDRPLPIRLGPRAVVLRWTLPEQLERRAHDLKASFVAATDADAEAIADRLQALDETAPTNDDQAPNDLNRKDASSRRLVVRRKRWLALLDESHRDLLDFLRRAVTSPATRVHLGGGGGADYSAHHHASTSRLSILDELEASDAEILTWKWVRERVAASVEIDGEKPGVLTAKGLVSTGDAARMVDAALASADERFYSKDAAAAHRFQQLAAPTTYVLERCASEKRGLYEEVLRTRFGEATVNGLDPNTTYRFRVRAVNAAGDVSNASDGCVLNTMLDTPPAPKLALVLHNTTNLIKSSGKNNVVKSDGVGGGLLTRYVVSSTAAKVAWPKATAVVLAANRKMESVDAASERILAEWTGVAGDDDGAVSLEAVFASLDSDKSGAFDGARLPDVLTRLGAHRTHASSAAAMRAVWDEVRDATRDVVRTSEFAAWWSSDRVTHVLQRTTTADDSSSTVTTYRGGGHATEVRGLEPNTQYAFTLRLVSSRSHSRLSAPLEVWTAPSEPSAPVVVRLAPKEAVLRWYPGPGGAPLKYALESRLVGTLDATTTALSSEWKVCYEGKETTVKVSDLAPRAAYRFRVRALNGAGHASEPSGLLQASTPSDPVFFTPRNVAKHFTVDCAGDVSVGDTILFTERLYVTREATHTLVGQAARGGKLLTNNNKTSSSTTTTTTSRHLGGSTAMGGPVVVGDRTVAAHVVADAFYTASNNNSSSSKRKKRRRDLRLVVAWSTVSTHEAAPFELRRGDVIQRDENHVLQFEAFRTPWFDEHKRRPNN